MRHPGLGRGQKPDRGASQELRGRRARAEGPGKGRRARAEGPGEGKKKGGLCEVAELSTRMLLFI